MMWREGWLVGSIVNGFWLAMMCVGILVTLLAATVCLGMIAYYQPDLEKLYPVLATFGAGAVMMLMAGAQLDRVGPSRRGDIE
jgi:hypothetical protein